MARGRVTTPSVAGRLSAVLCPVWRDGRIGLGIGLTVAALYGLVAGLWTPRGPITVTEALAAMALGLVVGVVAGIVLRTRWAIPLAPVVFAAAFELVRIGTSGPLVDGLHLDSAFGIIAFVLGRGLHGVLALVPMVLGAALGAGAARHLDGPDRDAPGWSRAGRWTRRSVAVLVAAGLLAFSVAIITPPATDVVPGADGTALNGSVAELTRVEIGGHELSMMIRGRSVDNPVLLFLAGGPGGTELGAMRRHGQALERDFTVVTLDQRGAGTSYDALDPTSTLTLDNAVSDAVEVTNYLRDRFGQDKIYVLGQSWGTILGVLAVQRHPELYRAYIGAGQIVDVRETDRIIYDDTLAWATRTGNAAALDTLTASGPPPYADLLGYEPVLSTYSNEVYPYDHSVNAEGAGGFLENIVVPEYSLLQKLQILPGFLDVFTVLYPQLQNVDFRTDAVRLEVPVYLVQGRYEVRGRAEPAQEWFRVLVAPHKEVIVFDTSGHRPLFEQPDRFARFMTDAVRIPTIPDP